MKNENKQMKRGITLIEIILAIVLIAIILGITIPKLMSNSQQAEVKQVISSDVKSIIEACALWRKQTSGTNGSFQTLTPQAISSILPSNMQIDTTTGLIYSSGFRTGDNVAAGFDDTGVHYTVRWHFDAARVDGGSFSIGMDITRGGTELGWDDKIQTYALESFNNTVREISSKESAPATWATDAAFAGTANTNAQGAITCSNRNLTSCFDNVNIR